MISTAENPWPLITFNLREGKIGQGEVGDLLEEDLKKKKNTFFSFVAMCVGG